MDDVMWDELFRLRAEANELAIYIRRALQALVVAYVSVLFVVVAIIVRQVSCG
jgi:hypothetical protein